MISLAEKGLSKLKWMKTSGQLWLDPLPDLKKGHYLALRVNSRFKDGVNQAAGPNLSSSAAESADLHPRLFGSKWSGGSKWSQSCGSKWSQTKSISNICAFTKDRWRCLWKLAGLVFFDWEILIFFEAKMHQMSIIHFSFSCRVPVLTSFRITTNYLDKT